MSDQGPFSDQPDWKLPQGAQVPPMEITSLKQQMGWPEAVSNAVLCICITVILVVLFMCLWGSW